MLALYLILFVFLFSRMAVAGYNYFTLPRLNRQHSGAGDLLSILIPARNEENNISTLLKSVLTQRNIKFEIIVLDDHSTDDTAVILERFAAKHSCIKVLKGQPLPSDWTGKNYACHQLSKAAKGKYIVFLDADVELHPDALASALSQMRKKDLSLLSLFPDQQTTTLGEQMTVPLMNYLLLTLLPLRLIESHRFPVFSAACGQFMMFNAADYQKHQWHFKARGKIAEDLVIMKLVKQSGSRGEGLMAGGLIRCRMYMGFQEAVKGFSKNFIAPFNDSVALFIGFLSLLVVGPAILIYIAPWHMLALFAIMIAITRFFTAMLSGRNFIFELLLHPLQIFSLLCISSLAIYSKFNRSVSWKGREFATY